MRWKPRLRDVDWLHAGFSERAGGVSTVYGGRSLNLGWTAEDEAGRVAENRQRWVREVWQGTVPGEGDGREVEATAPELVTLGQVHSGDTVVVRKRDGPRVDGNGRTLLRGDGLMTDEPGLLLGIQTADCVPVLVADTRLRAVAAFHAGWRGTVSRIVERGVEQMKLEYGSRGDDLVAAVGPAIAACCYGVGEEVRERFGAEFPYGSELFVRRESGPRWSGLQWSGPRALERGKGVAVEAGPDQLYLDLHEANRRQLMEAGVRPERIDVLGAECTACSQDGDCGPRYFSYRAERGVTGRMMAVIGVCSDTGED